LKNKFLSQITRKKNFLCYTILISVILFGNIWKIYPIYGSYLFQDWTYIFDFKNCSENNNLSPADLCPVILEYKFVYPKIWLNLSNITDNRDLFKFLITPFLFIYIYLCSKILGKDKLIINLLFLLSPVSILLLQRGNNDLVVLILIFLFYFSLTKESIKYYSLLFLIIAVKAKIYPIILIPIFLVKDNFYKNKLLLMLLLSILFIILLYFSEYFQLVKDYNKSGVLLAFSSTVLFKLFNFITNYTLDYDVITKILLIGIIIGSYFTKVNLPEIEEKKEISFLIGSAIIVSSFFLNEGFVYRLVFIIFTLPLILEYKKLLNKKIYLYLLIISILSIWIEYLTWSIEKIYSIDLQYLKENPTFTYKNIIYGFSIVFKNIIYWLLNINLIFISTKIFFRSLVRLPINKG